MIFLTDVSNAEKEESTFKEFLGTINQRALQIIWLCVISLLLCQLLKFIILSVKHKKVIWKYIVTTGGFPSSHCALCMTLVTSLFLFQMHDLSGKIDWSFAVAVVVSLVIVHDAMGVRLEASKHAKILNNMTEEMSKEEKEAIGFDKSGRLKELLGHKAFEVFGGVLFGFIIGLAGYLILVNF